MDTGILDTMLATIAGYTTGASGTITGYATSLYGILILLDFILAVLLNIGEVDHIKQLVKKVLFYGFWIWIIREWGTLCDALLDSLMITGTAVGGVDASVLKTPSLLIVKGTAIADPYWQYASQMDWLDITTSPLNWLMAVIGYAGVVLAFGILALQIFITYVEFYIASTLLLIFIPWGSFKHTSFVAEKAIGAVISYGTKLMMLGAVYGLSSGIINSMTVSLNSEPEPGTVFASMLGPFALCLLCWQAPGMAAGLMTGAPTLTAGTAAGTMVAGAAGAAAGGAAGAGAVGIATSGMSSAAKIASGIAGTSSPVAGGAAADGAAGAMQGAASFASSAFKSTGVGTSQGVSSAFSSGGTSASVSGTLAGSSATASGAAGTMAGSTTAASTSGGTSGAVSAKAASGFGMDSATSAMANSGSGVKTSSAFAAGSVNTGSSSAGGSSHTSASSAFQKAINETKQAVPPEATPQGGFSVPLPHDD